jgi:hypothetical protein
MKRNYLNWELQLPLQKAWEKETAQELSCILSGLCSRGYDSPRDLAERLAEVIDFLLETEIGHESFRAMRDPLDRDSIKQKSFGSTGKHLTCAGEGQSDSD